MKYITYKFYNRKKQRLTVFADENNGNLEIGVVACSSKDQFNKRWIREKIEGDQEGIHIQKFSIPIQEDKPGKTFMAWCHNNFLKNEAVMVTMNVLTNIPKSDMGHILIEITNSKAFPGGILQL